MSTTPTPYAGMEPSPGIRLTQLLGRGGYGEVWEAAKADGSQIALKFMPFGDGLSAPQEIRAIQMIRQLEHPGLVQIEQIWSQPGYLVVVMELADGSLADLAGAYRAEFGTPIVAEQVCLYLSQVAAALDFLNARQHVINGSPAAVQHGDVKPSNILVFGSAAKLCDFGLSSQTSSRTTRAHRKQGTLDYAAPEVFEGRLSNQSDQYALAVTYCELRGGRLPFPSVSSFKDGRLTGRPAPDLSALPPAEQKIIARALRPVPQERWPSCGEMLDELSQAVT